MVAFGRNSEGSVQLKPVLIGNHQFWVHKNGFAIKKNDFKVVKNPFEVQKSRFKVRKIGLEIEQNPV